MKVRLFSGNVKIAEKNLTTDEDYRRVGHATMLIFQGHHYVFQGIFDGCVNFEACEGPVMVDGFFTPISGVRS